MNLIQSKQHIFQMYMVKKFGKSVNTIFVHKRFYREFFRLFHYLFFTITSSKNFQIYFDFQILLEWMDLKRHKHLKLFQLFLSFVISTF